MEEEEEEEEVEEVERESTRRLKIIRKDAENITIFTNYRQYDFTLPRC